MAHKDLQFCWHGIITTDLDKATAFYTEVLGWTAERSSMGDDVITTFSANGIQRSHLMTPPTPGIPSMWEHYLRVADVDAAVSAAAVHGGTVHVPGMDIPPGRFAVVASPSGATLWLFREADPNEDNAPRDDLGGICWVECNSTDLEADLAWLEASFGITNKPMEGPDLPAGGYTLLLDGAGEPLGGIMASMDPTMPSHWMAWVAVDDVDACLVRAQRLGGQPLMEPLDMAGVGRMAALLDSTGAVFGVITPEQS